MANFNLSGGADSLTGGDAQVDVFFVATNGRLAATDTIEGGDGPQFDYLRFTAALTLAADALLNTRGIERLQFTTANPVSVTLLDAMAASSDSGLIEVLGGAGAETVIGTAVLATTLFMIAGAGDDLMVGGGGADTLFADAGADTMLGGAGDDVVQLLFGDFTAADRFEGGAGNDTLSLTDGAGSLSAALFAAIAGFERIQMDPFAAVAALVNVPGSYAADGPLALVTAQGNDTLRGSEATLALLLDGFSGNDRLTGSAFADTLLGGAGTDVLLGEAGNDMVYGGDGNDRLTGGTGNDLLAGDAGNDTIAAGLGNDTIELGTGTDRVEGGAGNDFYRVTVGQLDSTDLISDESGLFDTLDLTAVTGFSLGASLSTRLIGLERFLFGAGADIFSPSQTLFDGVAAGTMTVDGGAGDDVLNVGNAAWLIEPLRFLLIGGEGADTLIGDDGADTLDGGLGGGLLQGGQGNDLFLLPTGGLALPTIINGGDGFADVLRLTGAGTVDAAGLANTGGIERIEFGIEGVALTLSQAVVTGVSILGLDFEVVGNQGDDTVTSTGLNAGTDLAVTLGGGEDSFAGGAGDETVSPGTGMDVIQLGTGFDRVLFGVNELTAADTVGADTLDGDVMEVLLAAGRTLPFTAFAGVTGIDSFFFEAVGGTAAVRLPGTLVSQSSQTSVHVDINGAEGVVVDGRLVATGIVYSGGTGNDILMAGTGADTLNGSSGEDTLVGGDGGDQIGLSSGGDDRDLALIVSQLDGSSDINSTTSLTTVDRVSGLASDGNYIAVDWQRLGLAGSSTLFLNAGNNIEMGWGANVLASSEEIAANNFGSLAAVRATVGSRISGNAGVGEAMILVIGGADETEFGVYFFQDGDNNATIDTADTLRLLAIGDTDVPTFNSGRGFTTTTFDLV